MYLEENEKDVCQQIREVPPQLCPILPNVNSSTWAVGSPGYSKCKQMTTVSAQNDHP